MAWTDPRTWTTGEVVTASIMNTHVRDNLSYLYDNTWRVIAQATPSAATISFTSIPGTYRDLRIVLHGRGNAAVTNADVILRVNSDTGSNYDRVFDGYDASTDTDGFNEGQTSLGIGQIPGTNATANRAGVMDLLIPNYSGTTFQKTFITTSGYHDAGASARVFEFVGHWRSTSAITQIDIHFSAIGTGFVSGTIATLEGRADG